MHRGGALTLIDPIINTREGNVEYIQASSLQI